MAGLVPGVRTPGQQVDADALLRVDQPPRFVSRGGEKLAAALAAFPVRVAGRLCLDVGASTGGFTDCLLQAGAARVIALDVGHGQLHPRLRADERVAVLERVNARHTTALPYPPDLVACDVSFISARVALPPLLPLCAPAVELLVLVKPQFEAGRAEAPRGVVRDPEVHIRVLRDVTAAASSWGLRLRGIVDSGQPGPKGNREFFLHLTRGEEAGGHDDVDRWITEAVADG